MSTSQSIDQSINQSINQSVPVDRTACSSSGQFEAAVRTQTVGEPPPEPRPVVADDDGTQLYTYDLVDEDIRSAKSRAAFKASGLTERPRFRTPGLARAAYDRVARGRGLIPGAPTSQPGR